ncbi:hypothetical protein VO56_02150 [Mycoplasmopsis gallinacea]|uniref:Lipoprotein n=1 Tax=Mycoplasmopsis gallinacea TaxID=29556 RepID=A0A0D5ZJT9_9BACT|nr:hypothetical protein VO56_02150 [Mycoplasmopsis gallinacea]
MKKKIKFLLKASALLTTTTFPLLVQSCDILNFSTTTPPYVDKWVRKQRNGGKLDKDGNVESPSNEKYGVYEQEYSIEWPTLDLESYENIGKFYDFMNNLPSIMETYYGNSEEIREELLEKVNEAKKYYENEEELDNYFANQRKEIEKKYNSKKEELKDLIVNSILENETEENKETYYNIASYENFLSLIERQFEMESDELDDSILDGEEDNENFDPDDASTFTNSSKTQVEKNNLKFYVSALGDQYGEVLFLEYLLRLFDFIEAKVRFNRFLIEYLDKEELSLETQLKMTYADKEVYEEKQKPVLVAERRTEEQWKEFKREKELEHQDKLELNEFLKELASKALFLLHPAYYLDWNFALGKNSAGSKLGLDSENESSRDKGFTSNGWYTENEWNKLYNNRALIPFWNNADYTNLDSAKIWNETFLFLNTIFAFNVIVNNAEQAIQSQRDIILGKFDNLAPFDSVREIKEKILWDLTKIMKKSDEKPSEITNFNYFSNNQFPTNWKNFIAFFNRNEFYATKPVYQTTKFLFDVNWNMNKDEAFNVISKYLETEEIDKKSLKELLGLQYSQIRDLETERREN